MHKQFEYGEISMKSICMNKIAILCFALVMILCGCTSSMDYSDEVTDGPWTAVISGEGGSAFVVSYLWDGTKEGLRLEPNTVSGCFVTGFGGYMGRGLPMPFYLDIPGARTTDASGVPEDAEFEDITFTIVIGNQIDEFFCRSLGGYYYSLDGEEEPDKYYRVMVRFEVDPGNRTYYSKDGRLYISEDDTLYDEIFYDLEDFEEPSDVTESRDDEDTDNIDNTDAIDTSDAEGDIAADDGVEGTNGSGGADVDNGMEGIDSTDISNGTDGT